MNVEILAAILVKAVGSFAGAVLALVFQQPKTVAEFFTRASFSIIAGVLFSAPVREYLKWPERLDMELAAAGLVAALSWYLMAAVIRLIGAWKPKE